MKKNLIGKIILVVDDDYSSLLLFNEMLNVSGATVICVSDGKEAIEVIKTKHVDLILMDIKLTDISGYALLAEIRKIDPLAKAIAQTALTSDAFSKCMDAGFDDYLAKPVNSSELFAKMDRFLK